jgi:hypothetical protein
LLSCAAGALEYRFAARLAAASGRDVLAAQSDLFVSLDGPGGAEVLTTDGVSWLLFTPEGSVWDTVNDEVDGELHPIDGFTATDGLRPPGRHGRPVR